MPYPRPTLQALTDRLLGDLASYLSETDPQRRRSVLNTLGRSLAGSHHEIFGYIEWIALQAFPDTAEGPELEQWAEIWEISRLPVVKATGVITVAGTAGTVIAEGTTWRSGAQLDYVSDEEETVGAGGTVDIAVTAAAAGTASNLALAAKMSLTSPIAGVESEATVQTALTGGADVESDASLLSRLLIRLRNPPRGGAFSDYELWGQNGHPDVSRVFVRPLERGLGTVNVYFMTDDATANGIPEAATVAAVNTYIQARRPVTADVQVSAPAAAPLDIAISMLNPSTDDVQNAIRAELKDLIQREADVGGMLNGEQQGTLLLSHIREAISTAEGEVNHVLTAPVADVQVAAGTIITLGNVTFS